MVDSVEFILMVDSVGDVWNSYITEIEQTVGL